MLSSRLLQCLGPVNTLIAKGCSEIGIAMNLSNYVFCQYLSCSKFYVDSKNAIKYPLEVFGFKINAFELVAVISPSNGGNTSYLQSMC